MTVETFEIGHTSKGTAWIVCRLCGRLSFNSTDVAVRYCGFCHMFHDIVAVAREAIEDGGTHDCGEWRLPNARCALCWRELQETKCP